MTEDVWDKLSGTFAARGDQDEIPADAADNILIAWPPILELLEQRCPPEASVLDFGCGGGRLAAELGGRGYKAMGIDPSRQMIESAVEAFGASADFHHGGSNDVVGRGPFGAITSIMALQFVDDIQDALSSLAGALTESGVIVFAVHNPTYVAHGIERDRYPAYEPARFGRRTVLTLHGTIKIPMFIRTAEEYDEIAASVGLRRIFCAEPRFTLEFIERYGIGSTDLSSYLILGYEKA